MRTLRAVLLGAMALGLGTAVRATQITVGEGGGTGIQSVGNTFLFFSTTGTSPGTSNCMVGVVLDPSCTFSNGTGTTFSSLTFDVDITATIITVCGVGLGGPFSTCMIGPDSDGFVALFSGGPGVAPGGDFSISVETWPANTEFDVGATSAVPEPGTVLLLLSGVVLGVAVRRHMLLSLAR